jgi:hypothetical protein
MQWNISGRLFFLLSFSWAMVFRFRCLFLRSLFFSGFSPELVFSNVSLGFSGWGTGVDTVASPSRSLELLR